MDPKPQHLPQPPGHSLSRVGGQEPPALAGTLQDLRALDRASLAPLLAEEAACLWEGPHWQLRSLDEEARGIAWVDGDRALGYLTLLLDGGTALAGRLFASRRGPAQAVEEALLGAAIRGAFGLPQVEQFCGELFLLTGGSLARVRQLWPGQVRDRCLLEVSWGQVPRPRDPEARPGLEPWVQGFLPAAADLLVDVYGNRTGFWPGLQGVEPARASRLLEDITLRSEVGSFEAGASFVLRDDSGQGLAAFVLATRMGAGVGHLAQVAVASGSRRRGLGRALVVRALEGLQARGCTTTHLAVHEGNDPALALYRGLGFQLRHRFLELRLGPSEAALA